MAVMKQWVHGMSIEVEDGWGIGCYETMGSWYGY